MKITYMMIVLNGEPFIKYQLDSIYRFADQIIIVEGAVERFKHAANEYGHSTDQTLDIIKNYHDPDKKIVLTGKDHGFFHEKDEMVNAAIPHITGDILWHTDVDEFYLPETHEYIRKMFETDAELDRASFNLRDFFGGISYYIEGYKAIGLDGVNRVFRFNKGNKWFSHRPPSLADVSGRKIVPRKFLDGDTLEKQGHLIHHATLLFEKQVVDKYKYYGTMWKSISKTEPWLKHVWYSYDNKLNAAGFTSCATYLIEYKGNVSPQLQRLWEDAFSGKCEGAQLRRSDDLAAFMNSVYSCKCREIGRQLNEFKVQTQNRLKTPNSRRLLVDVIFELDRYTRLFALSIYIQVLKSSIKNKCKSLIKFKTALLRK